MTNIFKRIQNTVSADIHQALDQKEQKNPIAMLNQYLRECEKEIEKMKQAIERHYLLKEEFSREYKAAVELTEKRKHQAEVAQRAGEEELYNFAIQDQTHYQERANRLKESKEITAKQLEELEKKYEEMQHKLKDMHVKKLELMGRENIARAHHQANRVLGQTTELNEPFNRFSEMETYLDRIERQVNTSYYCNTIDGRVAQLEKELSETSNA